MRALIISPRELALIAIPIASNVVMALFWFGAAGLLAPGELANVRALQAFATILIPLVSCGLPLGVLVFASTPDLKQSVAAGMRRLILVVFIVGGVVLAVLTPLSTLAPVFGDMPAYLPLLFFSFLPFSISIDLISFFYQASNAVRPLLMTSFLPRLVHFAGGIALAWFWGLAGLIASFPIAYAAVFCVNLPRLAPKSAASLTIPLAHMLRTSARFIPQATVYNIAVFLDLLLLNTLVEDPAERGGYAFAHVVFSLASMAKNVVQTRLTVLFSANDHFKRRKLDYLKWALLAGMLAVAAYCVAALLAQFVVDRATSGKYSVAASFVVAMAIRVGLEWFTCVLAVYAHVRGRIFGQSVGIVVATIFAAILAVVLAPSYGALGLAWAQVVAAAVFLAFAAAVFLRAPKDVRIGSSMKSAMQVSK